jgi:hypothetical protein
MERQRERESRFMWIYTYILNIHAYLRKNTYIHIHTLRLA